MDGSNRVGCEVKEEMRALVLLLNWEGSKVQ